MKLRKGLPVKSLEIFECDAVLLMMFDLLLPLVLAIGFLFRVFLLALFAFLFALVF